MKIISEETKRGEPPGRGVPPEEHALEVTFPVFPSIEAYHELALHRMREGPACIRVNGLLLRDPFCPTCNAKRAMGPSATNARG